MRAWEDDGANVPRAVMGARTVRVLERFDSAYRGGCRDEQADQWASGSALRSQCEDCAQSSGAFAAWAVGPCDGCGRAIGEPPEMVWVVRSNTVDVWVVVRFCATCAAADLKSIHQERERTSR